MHGATPTGEDPGRAAGDERPTAIATELSVVVVTYNDAGRIADCLDSILRACRGVTSFELLVVDSNSTDDTVAIASEYDATVCRIPDDTLTTPGAGRYVGTQRAQGESLLFVDGDVVLSDTGWVSDALSALRADPEIAGVGGHLNEQRSETVQHVDYCHSVALYDSAALADVGGFHPFLAAWEDLDMGFQLGIAGYDMCRLPTVVGHHPRRDSSVGQLQRWRQGYFRGSGQVCSKALTRPGLLGRWLWYFGGRIVSSAWLAVGLVAPLLGPLVAAGWLLASVVGGGLLCLRLGIGTGFRRVVSMLLFPLGFLLGFESIPDRSSFPLDAVEVRTQGSVWHPDQRRRPSAVD